MKDVTNILILGETGVGKSTWINAIAKYLSYDTFEKARLSNDKNALISSKFTYTKAQGEAITIQVGEASKNEDVESTGASTTQKPTSYILDIDEDTRIRLIDTPGIGDIEGISRDEKNFEMILDHMSKYDKIHGICILLKPIMNERLGITLKFCISELLTHLHKSAASNIMFCFTNCRGTMYRPGETLPFLKQLLAEFKKTTVTCHQDNTFCFDNESFRFLACLQNGIEFDESDVGAFTGSWDRAASETAKLFKYVQNLNPHDTKATISLNTSRTWIIELSKPIAEIQQNINRKIKAIEKATELNEAAEKGEDLTSKLKIKAINEAELNPTAANGENIIIWKDILTAALENLDKKKKEDEGELDIIMNISAKFACFLAKNCITPYNYDAERYGEYLIHKDKQAQGKSDEEVEKLKTTLESYKKMKEIIDQAIKNIDRSHDDSIKSPEEAVKLREQLFALPINEKTFKNIYKEMENIKSQFVFQEKTFIPKKRNQGFFKNSKNKAD